MDLTDRQEQLLLSIIQEFINTAEAVGSISLQSKYNLDLSPATIRNEMAELVLLGYLFQKHNSSGRIPTTKGWRYFIKNLDEGGFKEIDLKTKEDIKSDLFSIKSDEAELFKRALQHLSRISSNTAIALIDNQIYHSGLFEMVNIPEFKEHEDLEKILKMLENYSTLSEVLNNGVHDNDINILIGEESEIDAFKDYAVIFSEIRINGKSKGYIAVIGPNRMRYDLIIPAVKYLADLVKYLIKHG